MVLRRNLRKRMENTCFSLEPMENVRKTYVCEVNTNKKQKSKNVKPAPTTDQTKEQTKANTNKQSKTIKKK